MKTTNKSVLMGALSAAIAMGGAAVQAAANMLKPNTTGSERGDHGKGKNKRHNRGKERYGNRPGRRYPEQSTRQAMRRHRRAQGGPGLMFDPGTGSWERRPDGIVVERPLVVPF
jgi:hypothetical protein